MTKIKLIINSIFFVNNASKSKYSLTWHVLITSLLINISNLKFHFNYQLILVIRFYLIKQKPFEFDSKIILLYIMSTKFKNQKQIEIPCPTLKQKLLSEDDASTQRSSLSTVINPQSESDGEKTPRLPKNKKQKKAFSWPVYKKFFKYTTNRWRLALVGMIFTILSAFLTSVVPYLVGDILDSITQARQDGDAMSMQQLNTQIFQLLYVIIGLGITTYLRYSSTQYLQQYLSIDMKMDVYSTFIKNDLYFFEQYKSGEFVSRLGNDINQAKSAVSNNLTFLIKNFVTIIANIIFLFVMSWKLTLSVMTILPMYAAITIYYSKRFKPLVKQYTDVLAEMSAHVSQKFSGIQLVKAYSNEEQQIQNYRAINEKALQVAKKKFFVQGIYMTFSTFLPTVGILIVLWYGGKLSIQGNAELTPGQLTSFIMYCTYLANNTSGISNSYSNIINGTAAVQKVFDMLSYEPQIQQGKGIVTQISGQISFRNVSFTYPSTEVEIFNNLNFKIKKGQYVAFAGQSGSGKSTIIKLIQKFYKTNNGKVFYDDIDSQRLNIREVRKQIGMVNQQATIFSGSIEENITYGLQNYTQQELVSASQQAGCLQFINNRSLFPQGFKTILGQKGSNLSGGQRQRISIARALIRRPKIIIFDEATSALDANSEQMVKQSIQSLASNFDRQITIIVIAHRLSTIINADRILMMKEGKLIEEGSHQQLKMKRGYYYELVEKQLQQN